MNEKLKKLKEEKKKMSLKHKLKILPVSTIRFAKIKTFYFVLCFPEVGTRAFSSIISGAINGALFTGHFGRYPNNTYSWLNKFSIASYPTDIVMHVKKNSKLPTACVPYQNIRKYIPSRILHTLCFSLLHLGFLLSVWFINSTSSSQW